MSEYEALQQVKLKTTTGAWETDLRRQLETVERKTKLQDVKKELHFDDLVKQFQRYYKLKRLLASKELSKLHEKATEQQWHCHDKIMVLMIAWYKKDVDPHYIEHILRLLK